MILLKPIVDLIITMKTYLLTFFIWTCCLTGLLYGQTDMPTDTDQSPSLTTEEQQTHPIDPNDPFFDPRDHPLKQPDNFQSKFFNMLLILGLLIGFMLLASWMLKRMMRSRITQLNDASAIKIRETRHLSARSTIYLLDVMGQGLVIAETPTGVSHLATVSLEGEKETSRPIFPPSKPGN
jgi:flagellar biogenesis protein FliO